MAYSKRQHLLDNINAIELALSGRNDFTPQEQDTLRRYSGFGGLKFILLSTDKPESWAKDEASFIPEVKRLTQIIKAASKDEQEEKRYWSSLRESVLTSFYTPREITETIVAALDIKVNAFLEPSAGAGAFIDAASPFKASETLAYENDLLTGKILKALHPNKDIRIEGFEELPGSLNNHFDLALSNIPFGNFNVFDLSYVRSKDKIKQQSCKTVHNYFFLKGVDAVRPGGVVAFITTTGVLDAPSNEQIRKHLVTNSNLVTCVRLPNSLFKDSANTEATSDLIILQKAQQPKKNIVNSGELAFIAGAEQYFSNRKSNIVATNVYQGTNQYGREATVYEHSGQIGDIAKDLKQILEREVRTKLQYLAYNKGLIQQQPNAIPSIAKGQSLQLDLFGHYQAKVEEKQQKEIFKGVTKPFYKEGTLVIQNDTIGFLSREDEKVRVGEEGSKMFTFNPFNAESNTPLNREKLSLYINIRDSYKDLYEYEAIQQKEHKEERERLNRFYDMFVEKYGCLNHESNTSLIYLDVHGNEMFAIEKAQGKHFVKTDIFSQPTTFSSQTIQVSTPAEALAVSMNTYGKPDLKYMSAITGHTQEEVLRSLNDQLYLNPITSELETKDRFLSGNMIKKARAIKQIIENSTTQNPQYQKSYQAAVKSIPEPIPFHELEFNLGERWIPTHYYEQFANDFFSDSKKVEFFIQYYKISDTFAINYKGWSAKTTDEFKLQTEGRRYKAEDLLTHAMLDTYPKITKTIKNELGVEVKIPDTKKIQEFNTLKDRIRSGFVEWLNIISRLGL